MRLGLVFLGLLLTSLSLPVAEASANADDESVFVERGGPLSVRAVAATKSKSEQSTTPASRRRVFEIHDTWRNSLVRCKSAGAGLLSLSSRSEVQRLRHSARRKRCYWTSGFYSADLNQFSWYGGESDGARLSSLIGRSKARSMIDRSYESRCLCLQLLSGRRFRLRLRDCRLRLPFVCERQKEAVAIKKEDTTKKDTTKEKTKTIDPEEVDFEDSGELNGPDSEVVDHTKFQRLEPPEPSAEPQTTTTVYTFDNFSVSTAADNSTGIEFEYQQFEVVALSLLYTVIAVSALVFASLCLLQCSRRNRKMHYVRQIDVHDIPRFMPSTWA